MPARTCSEAHRPTAQALAKAGVVRSRWDFLLARVASRSRVLQAGEYRFDRAASPMEVVRRIARGDIFYYELTVPEGRNLFDIAAAAEELGLFPARKFMAAAGDATMIQDLDPQVVVLLGEVAHRLLDLEPFRLGLPVTARAAQKVGANRIVGDR